MWRSLFIAFLVAHGLVHLAIWLMPKPADDKAPFDPDHSWLVGDQKRLPWSLHGRRLRYSWQEAWVSGHTPDGGGA